MRGTTGRAVSATIHNRLRQALTRGVPITYAQLALEAGCTVRSVRNYLARANEIFGFEVEHTRADDQRSVLVRAVRVPEPVSAPRSVEHLMAEALLDATLSNATRHLDDLPIVVSSSGLPALTQHQKKSMARWIEASCASPKHAQRVVSSGATELLLWPVGVVIHNREGVVLVGFAVHAESHDGPTIVPVASIADDPNAVSPCEEVFDHVPELHLTDLVQTLNLPLSPRVRSSDPKARVNVHVRFRPPISDSVRQGLWHPDQRSLLRTDGSLEVSFGPVDLDVAASWASGFGDGVRILGDKRLRKAVKKRTFRA